jgi:hypothetical protein
VNELNAGRNRATPALRSRRGGAGLFKQKQEEEEEEEEEKEIARLEGGYVAGGGGK